METTPCTLKKIQVPHLNSLLQLPIPILSLTLLDQTRRQTIKMWKKKPQIQQQEQHEEEEEEDEDITVEARLCDACGEGNIQLVKELLYTQQVDPSVFHNYAIEVATRNGHAEIVNNC